MKQIKIFENKEFGSIRVIEDGDKYLFCGSDVAKALGYARPNDAVARHCRATVKRSSPVSGKMQEINFVSEGDVYRLIAHSKLPSAVHFEVWVFDEVLPSIHKHGAYITQEKLWELATSPEALMKLCTDLLAEREENAALREANTVLKQKAAYFDLFLETDYCSNLRITAKELNVPERRFVRFLLDQRFVYRSQSGNVLPYAKPENEGLFCVKDYYNNGHLGSYTLVTPLGKHFFAGQRELILVTI